MIHFDEVDFSERHSEEVISFFWRSVYMYMKTKVVYDSSQGGPNWPVKGGGGGGVEGGQGKIQFLSSSSNAWSKWSSFGPSEVPPVKA